MPTLEKSVNLNREAQGTVLCVLSRGADFLFSCPYNVRQGEKVSGVSEKFFPAPMNAGVASPSPTGGREKRIPPSTPSVSSQTRCHLPLQGRQGRCVGAGITRPLVGHAHTSAGGAYPKGHLAPPLWGRGKRIAAENPFRQRRALHAAATSPCRGGKAHRWGKHRHGETSGCRLNTGGAFLRLR